VPTLNSKVFFEIKKKYNGTVYKRRETLKLKDVYTYLKTGKYKETQIMKEIDYCFKNYQLKPVIYLAYDRFAYRAIDDENFRVTFDYNIRSRKTKIQLDQGDRGKRLLRKNQYIMEVKCLEAMPLWFCEILSNLKIYPTSFSKYGKIYEKNFMGG
jgi:SPX domain protein involved in polyphosphate accumulation